MQNYSLSVIHESVDKLVHCRARYDDIRHVLPYLMHNIEGIWIPMNRDYKPLGFGRHKWIKYEDYKFLGIPEEFINFQHLKVISDRAIHAGQCFFFFSDNTTPDRVKDKKAYGKLIHEIFNFESLK